MALRVLLADESSTIKKVFQLALQDFAVDVRPVNVGTDVVHVARDFKPDLIFADVLLQKRSGYEVAAELKQTAGLNDIPVVLMFSGFIDLDEDKYQASHANAKLEKPFEVAALRQLVTDLVPRTQNQRLSQFLTFPKMPEMQEPAAQVAPPPAPTATPADEFEQVSIPKMKGQPDKYRVNLTPQDLDTSSVPVDLEVGDDAVDVGALLEPGDEDDNFAFGENTMAAAKPPGPRPRFGNRTGTVRRRRRLSQPGQSAARAVRGARTRARADRPRAGRGRNRTHRARPKRRADRKRGLEDRARSGRADHRA